MNIFEQWIAEHYPDGIKMTPEALGTALSDFVLQDLRTRYPGQDEEFYAMKLYDFAQYFTNEMLNRYGVNKDQPS